MFWFYSVYDLLCKWSFKFDFTLWNHLFQTFSSFTTSRNLKVQTILKKKFKKEMYSHSFLVHTLNNSNSYNFCGVYCIVKARCSYKCFTVLIHLTSVTTHWGNCSTERLRNLSEVTQQKNGGARMKTQAFWLQSPCLQSLREAAFHSSLVSTYKATRTSLIAVRGKLFSCFK